MEIDICACFISENAIFSLLKTHVERAKTLLMARITHLTIPSLYLQLLFLVLFGPRAEKFDKGEI
jgi:hypothetical protein